MNLQPTRAILAELQVHPLNCSWQCDQIMGLSHVALLENIYGSSQREVLYSGLFQCYWWEMDCFWERRPKGLYMGSSKSWGGPNSWRTWRWESYFLTESDNLIGCPGVVVAVATHPQQNMIASGSIEPDLTVRIWSDRGSTCWSTVTDVHCVWSCMPSSTSIGLFVVYTILHLIYNSQMHGKPNNSINVWKF